MMAGEYADDPDNRQDADHWLNRQGYIAIVAHNIDTTDSEETLRMRKAGFDTDF